MKTNQLTVKKILLKKTKVLCRFTIYGFCASVLAVMYGYITYPLIYTLLDAGRIFEAYAYSLVVIVVLLLFDKALMCKFMMHRLIALRKLLSKNLLTKIIRTFLLPKVGLVSVKSGLYLFYIFVLIQAKVLQLDTPFFISDSFGQYIVTMEYGLVLLVAADMFIKQLGTDHRRIQEMNAMERLYDEKAGGC